MADNYIQGTGENGEDLDPGGFLAKFLDNLHARQEAVWTVVMHGRVVIDTGWEPAPWGGYDQVLRPQHCSIYLQRQHQPWWEANESTCWSALRAAMKGAFSVSDNWVGDYSSLEWLLDVPPELVHFLAENTGRPKPRRYNSTAVTYMERDGVAWLTPPEVKLYDALKETGWLFVPQPPFLAGDRSFDRRPDFLIYWNHKAQLPVLVEIDSDRFHPPSQREDDEAKERHFESKGFHFLRFSAAAVNKDPMKVIQQIAEYCRGRFGQ